MNWFLKYAAKRAAKQAAKKAANQVAKQAAMQAELAAKRASQAAQAAAMEAIDAPHTKDFAEPTPNQSSSPFSKQGTKLTDSTFADTIGLAMHNAINNQQQSQVTTTATVASTCARILAASVSSTVPTPKTNSLIGKVKPDGIVLHNPKTQ